MTRPSRRRGRLLSDPARQLVRNIGLTLGALMVIGICLEAAERLGLQGLG